jgi:hypothetical protein
MRLPIRAMPPLQKYIPRPFMADTPSAIPRWGVPCVSRCRVGSSLWGRGRCHKTPVVQEDIDARRTAFKHEPVLKILGLPHPVKAVFAIQCPSQRTGFPPQIGAPHPATPPPRFIASRRRREPAAVRVGFTRIAPIPAGLRLPHAVGDLAAVGDAVVNRIGVIRILTPEAMPALKHCFGNRGNDRGGSGRDARTRRRQIQGQRSWYRRGRWAPPP